MSHHLLLLVNNVDVSIAFYQKLGFILTHQGGPVAILHRDDCEIHCLDRTAARPEFQKDSQGLDGGHGAYLFLQTNSIDEIYNDLATKNVPVSQPPKDWPWGNREFDLTDPDGYPIVFFQKIH